MLISNDANSEKVYKQRRTAEGSGTARRGSAKGEGRVAGYRVDNNGAAATVMMFDRLGKKIRPGTVGKTKVG